MKKTLLFCSGASGSGKSYFIKNILPSGTFYNLKSATTRPRREGEKDGCEYYFRDEAYFDKEKFATKLFVNEQLFASESLKRKSMPFDLTYVHRHQLYRIKRALAGQPYEYGIAPNFSAKSRAHCGATPNQVSALRVAWFKSGNTNNELCSKLGNSR